MLENLEPSNTFKIDGSSFVFMRMDVEGLTVQPKRQEDDPDESQPIRVLVPDRKTPVLCLNNGKAQFLKLDEKVQIVKIEANEILDTVDKKEN